MNRQRQSTEKNLSRPWVRSGAILGIVDFLERNGFDPESVVGASSMKMVEAADAYRQVDLFNTWAIFKKVADVTNRSDIGLDLGLSVDPVQLGPFGYLFMNAPTLGTALTDFVRYFPAFQSQALIRLKRGKRRISVEYYSNHPEVPGWKIDSEVTVGLIMGIVRKLLKRNIVPDEIHLDHPPICKPNDYLRLLSIRPSFNRRMVRLFYPLALIDEPIPEADPLLYAVLCRHMSDLAKSMPRENNLIDIIANNIRRGLGSNAVTLEHIASEVGVEARTLQRKLIKRGTTYQKIFDQVRKELSIYYLERTALGVTEIGLELGYAETSAFCRAFKRWTGLAPGSYRKRHATGEART